MTSSQALVSAYWAAAEARDWDAFGRLLAEDVVYEAPMSHERVSGKPAYLRFNAEGFTTDWHLTVQRIVADEGSAASWIQMTETGETYPGLTFFAIADGLIARITDFWPQEYEPPASRAHLTERVLRGLRVSGQVGEPAAAPVGRALSQRLRVRSQSSGTVKASPWESSLSQSSTGTRHSTSNSMPLGSLAYSDLESR